MKIMRTFVAFLIACCASVSAGDRVMELIRANYPEELVTPAEYGEDLRLSTHVTVDLDGDRANDIVVLYSNTGAGILCAILSTEANPARVCVDDFLTGTHGALERVDLESDGKPEFVVRLSSVGSGAGYAWIYRWNGGWVSLNPPDAPFRDPVFVDFDGDGDLDALDGLRFGSETQQVYLLEKGIFERAAADVLNWVTVHRGKASPARVVESIAIPENRRGAYPIRVVTNESVTSAKITVDGKVLFGPHDFRPGTRLLISDPVHLTETSEVEIELAGKPGAQLMLMVETR